ncbi:MAG: nucleoside-triphosphatase, partial [Candidatus Caldatribacteriaceae bacterium]
MVLGRPGAGKTTLVRKVIEAFPGCFRGFYTCEIRKQGERVGFAIPT